ncbi:class I adenylate-forming enzyme family protein [Nitriliruptor alkaliphilus]|uniref:class I adenylate-forming enzyme family protein n=1 Tax=Nitriliruptor alkaliphilus TaxID=427918 RepID=UPI000697C984|nr:class I adenylate-forming enzyme family protein [Nitriliruptor alkaliphilus]
MSRSELSALARGVGVHLGALTAVLADRYGDRPAVIDPERTPGLDHGETRSFTDIEDAVARLASVHAEAGVGPGDRVLVVCDNRLDVALHAFAIARLAAVPVPVNHRLTGHEIDVIGQATGATAAVADDEVADRVPDRLRLRRVSEVAEALPAAAHRAPAGDLDPDATAILLTTSGTTGVPKAAPLTSRGLLSSLGRLTVVPLGADLGPLRRDRDRILACLPLTHVMGFSVLLASLSAGLPLVRRARFRADEVLDLIEHHRPNVLVAVPTMFADLERAGAADRDLSSIQLFVSSADVLPPDRARRLQGYGGLARIAGRGVGSAAVVDIFGMVELSGPAAVRLYPPSPVGSLPAPSFAVTLPGVRLRVVDEDGRTVPRGTVGELQWRGPNVLGGYEGHVEGGPDADGWFGSGDQGRLLGGGLFQFAGRSKDRLKVGGFSVFPAEVEEELEGARGVAELAIVGVPDERLGERLVAVVVPTDGFDDHAFLRWARDQVAGYRRPSEVVVVDAIPRGPNGKLDREAGTQLAVDALSEEDA